MIQLKVLLLNRKIQKSKTSHLKVISFHYKTYPIVFQSSLVPVLLTFKFLYQIRLEIRRRNYCNSFLLRILSTKPYPPFYSTTSPPRPRKAISLFLSFASYRIVRNQCDGRAILRDGSVQEASKNSREGGRGEWILSQEEIEEIPDRLSTSLVEEDARILLARILFSLFSPYFLYLHCYNNPRPLLELFTRRLNLGTTRLL